MAAGVLSVGVSEAEIKGHKEPGGPLWPLPVYTYAGGAAEVPAQLPADTANGLFPGEAWL